MIQAPFSQSKEIPSDSCCFYGDGVSNNTRVLCIIFKSLLLSYYQPPSPYRNKDMASSLINPLKVTKLLTGKTNMLNNINAQCHLFNPCISLRRPVTPIFYITFLFFYMRSICYIRKNIISTIYIIFYFPRIRPKNTCLRRWKRHV